MTDLKQLEKEVGAIFIAAGFRVQHHTNLKNTPIDVLAEIDLPRVQKDFRVICKFKYEDSEEAVRELIMTWRNNKISPTHKFIKHGYKTNSKRNIWKCS